MKMDINKNIDELNTFFLINNFLPLDKLKIINIAKVSKNIDDLAENILWELNYKSLNYNKEI